MAKKTLWKPQRKRNDHHLCGQPLWGKLEPLKNWLRINLTITSGKPLGAFHTSGKNTETKNTIGTVPGLTCQLLVPQFPHFSLEMITAPPHRATVKINQYMQSTLNCAQYIGNSECMPAAIVVIISIVQHRPPPSPNTSWALCWGLCTQRSEERHSPWMCALQKHRQGTMEIQRRKPLSGEPRKCYGRGDIWVDS